MKHQRYMGRLFMISIFFVCALNSELHMTQYNTGKRTSAISTPGAEFRCLSQTFKDDINTDSRIYPESGYVAMEVLDQNTE